jgi:hypothetical protein
MSFIAWIQSQSITENRLILAVTFFKGRPTYPSLERKKTSNIQSRPRWIPVQIELKFCWKKLFVLIVTNSEETLIPLLKPLLKTVTPVVSSRMLWLLQATKWSQIVFISLITLTNI